MSEVLAQLPEHLVAQAHSLDEADALAAYRDEFVLSDDVVAYLDGNSLGRPLTVTRDRLAGFVQDDWGDRLIRAWDETWMDLPLQLGDTIGRVALGAAPYQVLYTFGPAFGLPDPSPFVTKVDVLLKLSGQPYATKIGDVRAAPKGKLPYIVDDGEIVADSTFIRWHME